MSADILLSLLSKVKQTKPGSWLACCPAHDDKSPSLGIRETADGRVLVHCFAGCAVHEIVSAVGLDASDLFPPRTEQQFIKGERRPFPAADILRALIPEIWINYLCAQAILKDEVLLAVDRERLLLAASRFQAALHAGGI